jgi:hypothetical protein
MWTQARLTIYITAGLGGLAALIAALGWGTFDKATWMFDPPAFDVRWLATQVTVYVAPFVAWVAVKLGWGKK